MPIDADRVVQAIRDVVPANAEINVVPGPGAFNARVAWRLNNDPERPNKMSKTLVVCITREAGQDFEAAPEPVQVAAYGRLTRFLTASFQGFDPSHNTPRYEAPPTEEWVVDSIAFVG